MCYFALTTFSTVGYGDFTPVSKIEMLFGVVIMLFGVGFFSFIMNSVMEILQSYDAKMGTADKTDDLKFWISQIQRFAPNSQLNQSLMENIFKDFIYYWQNDRISCADHNCDERMLLLPQHIKKEIFTDYVFQDIFKHHVRFFTKTIRKDIDFLYMVIYGMMPRKFHADDPDDKYICLEEQEIGEMYFITEGFIGIGFSMTGFSNQKS